MNVQVAYNDQEVETLGIAKSKNFGFSKDAEEMIFSMFTKNIYSNPIGSIVREITSNCFDSHIEANVSDPVFLKLTNENGQYYISFTDVGVGVSPERMHNVYSQYFESTKRNDNNQIGGFGLGCKTPLAYAESFFLITIFEGTKYTYSIRKGKSSPVLDLLTKKKTDQRNGTTVKIPIKSSDIGVFEKEIIRQLYYFENVIFEGFSGNVKNDYRILQGKNFLYRGRNFDYAHICLGRVAYPIDFSVLEDGGYNDPFQSGHWSVPVALKMEIGEINVTVSREAIDYTETTKKLIKKKLVDMKSELLAMLDKQHENLNSLEDYYRIQNDPSTLLLSKDDSINIGAFTTHRPVTIKKFNAIKVPSQFELIEHFYDISTFGKKTRKGHAWDKSLKGVENENVYMVFDSDQMTRKKNSYMKFTYKLFNTLKRSKLSFGDLKRIVKDLTPEKSVINSEIIFKQFRELQKDVYNLVEKKVKTYASVVVPDGFTVSSSKGYDPNQELPVTFDSKYGFTKERIKMEVLAKSKSTFFYGELNDQSVMSRYAHLYENLFLPHEDQNKFALLNYDSHAFPIRFIMVSKGNLKYITELKNAKPFTEFTKVLARKKETVLKQIEKEMFNERYENLSTLFLNDKLFSSIDKTYSDKVKALKDLKRKYDSVERYSVITNSGSDLLRILEIDRSKVTYNGHDLFAGIEKTTEKNGMLAYVRIDRDFNPNDKHSGYTEKEITDILKLLKLAYVQ